MPYPNIINLGLGIGLGYGLTPNQPTINYVARLNGSDQAWNPRETLSFNAGDELEFEYSSNEAWGNDRSNYFFDSSETPRAWLTASPFNDIVYDKDITDVYLDGEKVLRGVTKIPSDSLYHKFKMVFLSDGTITIFGGKPSGDEFNPSVFKNIKATISGNVLEVNLTDKNQGATQLPTQGEVSFTMSNYDASVWEEVKELPPLSYDAFLSVGQSLSIGTLTEAYNPKPTQPQIDQSKYFMLEGVETTGVQDVELLPSEILSIEPLKEESHILSMEGYYTPASGFFSSLEDGDTPYKLWLQTGVGGKTLEELSQGGATYAYANGEVQLDYVASLPVDVDLKAILCIHGNENWRDTKQEYYDKLLAFRDEQVSMVKARLPSSEPDFIIQQNGGENILSGVMSAQLQAAKDGEARCIGATYWLNRAYPNVSKNNVANDGASSTEQIHLSVTGYQYLGDMVRRAYDDENFKPLYVTSYSWVSDSILELDLNIPSGDLVIDSTTYSELGEFNGGGFEVMKPNGVRVPASTVDVIGNKLRLDFDTETFNAGDRLGIGFTPRDITYYGDYEPNPQGDTYVGNHIVGTNVRTTTPHACTLAQDPYYDWLCVDIIDTNKNNTTPATQTLGSNAWRGDTQGYEGMGSKWVFDGVTGTVVKTLDGVETASTTQRDMGAFINSEVACWQIKVGKTYQIDFDTVDMNEAARFQINVGGVTTSVNASNLDELGHYTGEVVATDDHQMGIKLRENTGFAITEFSGTILNIQVRLKIQGV